MPDQARPTTRAALQFKREFQRKLRGARLAAGLDEATIARQLEITEEQYRTFETRTLPPHHLIPKICSAVNLNPNDLFAGKE